MKTIIGYKNPKYDLKTVYKISYVDNDVSWDRVCSDRHPSPWELYTEKSTEDFQQAIEIFICLFSQMVDEKSHVYDVSLFEETYLNGELIREQTITDIRNFTSVVDYVGDIRRNRIVDLETELTELRKEEDNFRSYLKNYKAEKYYDEYKNNMKKEQRQCTI